MTMGHLNDKPKEQRKLGDEMCGNGRTGHAANHGVLNLSGNGQIKV